MKAIIFDFDTLLLEEAENKQCEIVLSFIAEFNSFIKKAKEQSFSIGLILNDSQKIEFLSSIDPSLESMIDHFYRTDDLNLDSNGIVGEPLYYVVSSNIKIEPLKGAKVHVIGAAWNEDSKVLSLMNQTPYIIFTKFKSFASWMESNAF